MGRGSEILGSRIRMNSCRSSMPNLDVLFHMELNVEQKHNILKAAHDSVMTRGTTNVERQKRGRRYCNW